MNKLRKKTRGNTEGGEREKVKRISISINGTYGHFRFSEKTVGQVNFYVAFT